MKTQDGVTRVPAKDGATSSSDSSLCLKMMIHQSIEGILSHKTVKFGSIVRYSLLLGLALMAWQVRTFAQDIVVPAGTLIHCTLEEPNFSSATASVGDPVVCPLASLQEFGQTVFPRGSYLQGHLEADKEPGHFVGKGYLKLVFDRIGFSNTDVPVPSKLISVRGYRVDREGDIVGHGHATRDVVEWLLPPLWPWKVITLPARGSRPALKGEERLTLRLMEDIVVPKTPLGPGWHFFGEPSGKSSQNVPQTNWPEGSSNSVAPARLESFDSSHTATGRDHDQSRVTLIALKVEAIYAVTSYRVDAGRLVFVLQNGETGAVTLSQVDWKRTSQLNEAQNTRAMLQTELRTF
jgi:hypothetical protein